MTPDVTEGVHDYWVEIGAGPTFEDGDDVFVGAGRVITAAHDQGAIGVVDGEHARHLRDGDTRKAAGVTRAVEALMVRAHGEGKIRDIAVDRRQGSDDPLTILGMSAHDGEFACIEFVGVTQDAIRDADLADIMESSGRAGQVLITGV